MVTNFLLIGLFLWLNVYIQLITIADKLDLFTAIVLLSFFGLIGILLSYLVTLTTKNNV